MKDPIQKYFQVGTIQWMTHPPVDHPYRGSGDQGQGKGHAGPGPYEGVLRRPAPPVGT